MAGYVRETRAAAVGVVGLDYAVAGDVDATTREDDADGGVGRHARHRARRFGGCRGGEGEEWCLRRLALSAAPVGVSAVAGVGDERGGADADHNLLAALVRHRDACASAGATRVPAILIDASPDLALAALAALPDALLAFTGATTFRNPTTARAAFDCPMDRVALASECPEKIPAELAGRGRRGAPEWSHPATLAFAAARVAAVKGRGVTADDVVAAAAKNAARAFGVEDEDEKTPTSV